MKVLWVKAGGLLPLDTGGKIRSYQILRQLAQRHEITFFSFYKSISPDPHQQLDRLLARVIRQPLEISSGRGFEEFLNYARLLFSRLPYSMGKYYSPEVTKRLARVLKGTNFDAIVCDFIFAAGVIPWELPIPKILFAHNVETLIWKRHYDVARSPHWKIAFWREYRSMARAERSYAQLADRLLTVSETDRNFFSRFIDRRKISVVSTGVDVDYFRPAPVQGKTDTLVFTGSMDWMPNEDAVFYFVEKILPRIRSQCPDIQLTIVGRRPSRKLQALAERQTKITVTGAVEDIRPYVHNSAIYIVPLRVGGGTRLKIFEAMAMGKAVVSTSIGAEGLPIQHGENILLADDPDRFADQVVSLLRNPTAREKLGMSARRLVEQRYSWESVSSSFEAALDEVAGIHRRSQMNAGFAAAADVS